MLLITDSPHAHNFDNLQIEKIFLRSASKGKQAKNTNTDIPITIGTTNGFAGNFSGSNKERHKTERM